MSTDVLELDDLEVRRDLARQNEIKRRLLDMSRDFGIKFYRPFPKQDAFHRAGKNRLRMMRSGNRFGKSTLGCAEDCAWLMGERVWYPEGDFARREGIPQRPAKGLVITTDWDKVDEIWTGTEGEGGKIWRMLPKGFVKRTKRNHAGVIDTVECENGSTLRFDTVKSFLQNKQSAESSDWDFIHIDEPCPELMWKAASRGLMDRNGKAWFTLTPLSEFWINDLFFPQNPKDKRESVWAEMGNTRDNPHLPPEAIAEYEASLSTDERECRIKGIPLELSGLVYKEFNRDTHILKTLPAGWEAWDQPPLDHTIYAAIDPHPKTPHAVLFVAVGPHEVPIVYDEIFMQMTAHDLAQAVIHKLNGRNFVPVKCDPIAWISDPISGASMEREFHRAGLVVHKASKAREFGTLHMRSIFKAPRGIRFVPTVTYTLWELMRYCYDPNNNKFSDKDDHMMENMYRLFINNPCYTPFEASAPVAPIALDDVVIDPTKDDVVSAANLFDW